MRNRLLIKEEIKTALRKLIKEEITKKSDYQSVGLGGVNNPEDVEHILNLFSDPKVGFATDIEKIKRECSTENDFKKIGECKKFQDFIAEYQKTKVFPTGFNDSRIDPGMQTITLLYNTILGIKEKPKELSPGSEIELSGEIVPPKSLEYLVDLVINNIEGGYYYPAMKPYLRGGENLGKSGETLYGIDRFWGGENNKTALGQQFWNLVDAESGWAEQFKIDERIRIKAPGSLYNLIGTIMEINNEDKLFKVSIKGTEVNINFAQVEKLDKPKWEYGHKPENSEFRNIVRKMMPKNYESYKNALNVTAEMEKLIESDARLQFNFLYACWNGIGYFEKFYKDLIKFVRDNPNPNIIDVVKSALASRAVHMGGDRANKVKEVMNMIK